MQLTGNAPALQLLHLDKSMRKQLQAVARLFDLLEGLVSLFLGPKSLGYIPDDDLDGRFAAINEGNARRLDRHSRSVKPEESLADERAERRALIEFVYTLADHRPELRMNKIQQINIRELLARLRAENSRGSGL